MALPVARCLPRRAPLARDGGRSSNGTLEGTCTAEASVLAVRQRACTELDCNEVESMRERGAEHERRA